MNKKTIIIWGIIKRISIGFSFLAFVYFFVGAPMAISGQSMYPNLENNEFAWIDRTSYFFQNPKRGEVVVFRFPGTRQDLYVKRVIGLPGETIEIKENKIYINNQLLGESYYQGEIPSFGFQKIKLGKDEYFVLGDNRPASNDSRIWGPLSKKFIIGKLSFVFWPLNRRRFIWVPLYNLK